MKCELKGTVNMKLQGGETVKLTDILYVPQAVKIFLRISMLVSKGSITGDTKDRTTINKNGANMVLDTRKEKMRAPCST